MMDLEQRSFENRIHFYRDGLEYLEAHGKAPKTWTGKLKTSMHKWNITERNGHLMRLTDRALKALREDK